MARIHPLLLLLVAAAAHAVPQVAGVQNHWVANSGGTAFDHIQNFIEDMRVTPDGTVLTQSFYDEAQHPDCAYKDGKSVGYNWTRDTAIPNRSRRAKAAGVTWNIRRFWGRAFLGRVLPPSSPDSLPFVESSDGRTIRSLVDPTALDFDTKGRLLVAENGPDQNIKIFDVSGGAPRLVGSFGDFGGVFAGPVRGATGDRRFWGLRGVGVDSAGRLYVGNTGMPMQVGGGTDLRCFSGLGPRDTLVWQVLGLAFVNTVDADPDSGGTSLQKNHTRFHMDWSRPPGKSWSFAAVTSDPFKYPDDPRLVHSLESVWSRRIHGKPFLFLDDMYGNYLAVTRFEANSEIGVPSVFLPVGNFYRDSSSGPWALDRRPIWGAAAAKDYRRWLWRDDNGDGQVGSSEFHQFDLVFPSTRGIDIDDSGDIWWGGKPYIVQFPVGGLDAHGVPRYDPDSMRLWKVPFLERPENNGYVMQCRYLRGQDAMLVATGVHEGLIAEVFRYDHWSTTAKRFPGWGVASPPNDTLVETWKFAIPYKLPSDWSQSLDALVTDTCVFPDNMTADTDFVYVGYVDKGPDGHRNGEVSVFDIHTGRRTGWIAPGPETNFMSGWFDLWHALNAYTMPDGQKLLMTEDDYAGHVNLYKWCPHPSCPEPMAATAPRASRLRLVGGDLQLDISPGASWELEVFDFRGRRPDTRSGVGSASWPCPRSRGLVLGRLHSALGTATTTLLLP